MKLFRSTDRDDKIRNETAAASRIRGLGSLSTFEDADAEEVDRRLRNMSYGSTHHQVAATRS